MKNIRVAIAAKINANMLQLNNLQTQIAAIKAELEQFLEQYFVHISTQLPQHLLTDISHNNMQPTSQEHSHNFEQLIKQLYRTLAKRLHPDLWHPDLWHPDYSRPDCAPNHHDAMQRINSAYAQKQLGSLLVLSSELGLYDEVLQCDINDLLHYHELLVSNLHQAERELASLQQSDAMQLKRNILLARLNGYDMMGAVAHKLQQKYIIREAA